MEDKLDEVYKIAKANQQAINKNAENIESNFKKISENSFALDILRDYKHDATKWFIAFIVTLILLIIISIHHFIV